MRTNTPDAPDVCGAGATIASTLRDYPGMKKIIAEYVADLPGEVRKMQDLLNRGDMQPLRRVVHQLRGTGGGYGFELISDTAARAEEAIDAVESRAAVALKINSLIDVVRRTEGFDSSAAVSSGQGGML
jgi:HPt (histidine-containing phosphotransfer) domain-containing protein